MTRAPEILRHPEIIYHWQDYPIGSVERAKSLGLGLIDVCERVELSAELWEAELRLLDREQPWTALGLQSRQEFVERVTGKPETYHRTRAQSIAQAGVEPVAKHGGAREKPAGQPYNVRLPPHGNSGRYLVRRLARDRPDLVERLAKGEIRSARAAAIEAGIVKVPTVIDILRKAWRKATEAEREEFRREILDR